MIIKNRFFKGICMGQSTREGGGTTSGGDQAYRRHAASAQQTVQKVNKIYKKIKLRVNCLRSKPS
jgi:hypothetical protein